MESIDPLSVAAAPVLAYPVAWPNPTFPAAVDQQEWVAGAPIVSSSARPRKAAKASNKKSKVQQHPTAHDLASARANPPGLGQELWIHALLSASKSGSFFRPCPLHADMKKSEATLFCVDCDTPGGAVMCQHCAAGHAGHRSIQIRRYVYCDVVRTMDVGPYVDVSGIQAYTVNQARVVFLHPRPLAKMLPPTAAAAGGCGACGRALREGAAVCSLACKVQVLVQEGRLGRAALDGGVAAATEQHEQQQGFAQPSWLVSPEAAAAGAAGLQLLPGCCGGSVTAQPLLLPPLAAVGSPGTAASDDSDCGTLTNAAAIGLPIAAAAAGIPAGAIPLFAAAAVALDAPPRQAAAGRLSTDQSRPRAAATKAQAAAEAAAAGGWAAAKRHSDSSCQSFLDYHSAGGHVCRRKQPSPRRSPLV